MAVISWLIAGVNFGKLVRSELKYDLYIAYWLGIILSQYPTKNLNISRSRSESRKRKITIGSQKENIFIWASTGQKGIKNAGTENGLEQRCTVWGAWGCTCTPGHFQGNNIKKEGKHSEMRENSIAELTCPNFILYPSPLPPLCSFTLRLWNRMMGQHNARDAGTTASRTNIYLTPPYPRTCFLQFFLPSSPPYYSRIALICISSRQLPLFSPVFISVGSRRTKRRHCWSDRDQWRFLLGWFNLVSSPVSVRGCGYPIPARSSSISLLQASCIEFRFTIFWSYED